MNAVIRVDCLAVHADEVRLILETQKFKLIRPGKGSGRTVVLFEGQASLPIADFVAALENRLRINVSMRSK